MCGIVGIAKLNKQDAVDGLHVRQMLSMIRHRGPDEFGIYQDNHVGLGSARLSIIDLATGQQPITNEDESCWIVFNGEIFNYIELRQQLEKQGHCFTTQSDTEVILHLYEEYGIECLSHLNGQFALAIWDSRKERLFLGRDRMGIRPLFYAERNGMLVFGSEIKAILTHPSIQAEIDPESLHQIFTCWTTLSPNTAFKNILELPPGHYLVAQDQSIHVAPYWELDFQEDTSTEITPNIISQYVEELRDLLIDATTIRLRADVPVGAYLSGGLDSSIITSIIRHHTSNRLDTFSITFDDPDFDESSYQQQMVDLIGTAHKTTHTTQQAIGDIFPDVIWHTEIPILRTAPAPMYFLSKLVNDNHYKVVMTGEGADEFFGGYNIFKETMVRRFWARQPKSDMRPLLLQKLYPYLASTSRNPAFFQAFFKQSLSDTQLNHYSHILRWKNTERIKRFFAPDIRDMPVKPIDEEITYPDNFEGYHPLEKAQYLESKIFMSGYLLSSQGDRMGMANSVEGRYPFLDHRVVEFANRLPPTVKLRHLTEKYLLKELGKQWLPMDIWKRAKHPYRAPIHKSFFHDQSPDYVESLLSDHQVTHTGLFDRQAINQLLKKIKRGMPLGETENMAIAGILSTQILHHKFIQHFQMPPPISLDDCTKVIIKGSHSKEYNP